MKQELTDAQESWIQALESGKYNQGNSVLNRDNNFCCLGVACDLHKENLTVTQPSEAKAVWYDGDNCYAPEYIVGKLGLIDNVGESNDVDLKSLTVLNDEGKSFAEIAEILRSNPECYLISG